MSKPDLGLIDAFTGKPFRGATREVILFMRKMEKHRPESDQITFVSGGEWTVKINWHKTRTGP